jgi:hypothetical protein
MGIAQSLFIVSVPCRETQTKLRALFLCVLMGVVPANADDSQDQALRDANTANLELRIGQGKTKAITVTLAQSAREVYRLCRPAKVYADDDPWLICPAVGDGYYAIFFSAEGTAKEMQGRLDPSRDQLYAVVRYPTDTRENGKFLLPPSMKNRTCGDFVTLKVPLGPTKVRVATVAFGMTANDVMQIFQPAPDRAKADQLVLFDAMHRDGRYLLLFSPQDESDTRTPKVEELSQVIFWPGGQEESMFLLPRKNRDAPVPGKYRAVLEGGKSSKGSD